MRNSWMCNRFLCSSGPPFGPEALPLRLIRAGNLQREYYVRIFHNRNPILHMLTFVVFENEISCNGSGFQNGNLTGDMKFTNGF